ncbi:MAG: tetratricopeptide repeat protein [Chrysiogenetes bacterium]|nr:tetratricopeptide repeat protein [Chrysiogenetes bacterium]
MEEAPSIDSAPEPEPVSAYRPWERYVLLYTPLLLVLGLCALLYLPTLEAPFLFDDLEMIVNNESFIEGGTVAEYAEKFRFRQETMRSFKRDLNLSGGSVPNPAIFHAANVVSHLAVVALFYWMLLQLGERLGMRFRGKLALAFLGAGIFALHPMTTEPVAYVMGRADILATGYLLLALVLFLIPLSYQPEGEVGPDAQQARVTELPASTYWKVTLGCWMLALASFLKGVLCKEVAVIAPLLAALVIALVPGQTRPWRRRTFVALGLAFALVGALLVLRLLAFGTLGNPDTMRGLFPTMATNAFVTLLYLLTWIFPISQSGDHDTFILSGFANGWALAGVMGIAITLWAAWLLRRKYPEISLGLVWCLVGLLPTTSVIALEDVFVERRFYLSGMGLSLVSASVLVRMSGRVRLRRAELWQRWSRPVLAFAILAMMFVSLQRVLVWTDTIRFWADAAQKSRIKSRPYYNLGTALTEAGKNRNAIAAFATLFQRNAYDRDAHLNIANAMLQSGWTDMAAKIYKDNVLNLDPDNAEARYNLGVIAEQKGNYKEAEQYYKEALHLKPEMTDAGIKLGIFYFSRDEPRVALKYFEDALAQRPDDPLAHQYLALIYSQMIVDEPRALEHFEKLTKLQPQEAQNWFNLAVLQDRTSQPDAARRSYRRALDLQPTHVPSMVNLGALLERLGHRVEACQLYNQAASLDPAQAQLVQSRCSDLSPPLDSAR